MHTYLPALLIGLLGNVSHQGQARVSGEAQASRMALNDVRRFTRGDFVAVGEFIGSEKEVKVVERFKDKASEKLPFISYRFRIVSCNDPSTPSEISALRANSAQGSRYEKSFQLNLSQGARYLILGRRPHEGVLRAEDFEKTTWGRQKDQFTAKGDEVAIEEVSPTGCSLVPKASSPAFAYFQSRLESLSQGGTNAWQDALFFRRALLSNLTSRDFDGEQPTNWIRRVIDQGVIARAQRMSDINGRLIISCLGIQLGHRDIQRPTFSLLKSALESEAKLSNEAENCLSSIGFFPREVKPEELITLALRSSDPSMRRLLVGRSGSLPASPEGIKGLQLLLNDSNRDLAQALLCHLALLCQRSDLFPPVSQSSEIPPSWAALIEFWQSKSPQEILKMASSN